MKKYKLKNLDCANCAQSIEESLNKLDYVKSAKVLFASNSLIIDTVDLEAVKKELYAHEEVEIVDAKDYKDEEFDTKGELIKIVILVASFAVATYFYEFFNNATVTKVALVALVALYIIAGRGVITTAIKNIMKGEIFDENFLMTFASLAAFAVGANTEAVAVMLFYNIGEYFQDLAVNKSRRSIQSLVEVRPDYANVYVGEDVETQSPDDVKVGDIILVKAGEKIALDGVIVSGKTSVDKRALTGESLPVSVNVGDEVLAGSLNINGLIKVRVTKLFGESSVSKILDLVENASANKAKTESFITTFAKYYTPVVFAIASLIAILPPLLNFGTFSEWLYRALVVLVVSCPCALVVSVPLGYFGGIGSASRNGILVKGANYLEALSNVKAIVLDKTGTITKGVFNVAEINNVADVTKDDLLQYAAIAESRSNHPIAKSIVREYGKPFDINAISEYEEISGHGVRANYNGVEILAGNDKLLHKYNIEHAEQFCAADGGAIAHIAVDNKYLGYILVSDEIKPDSKQAIAELKSSGIAHISVLTGDNENASNLVLKDLNVDEIYTDLLPEDKASIFAKLKSKYAKDGKIIFVGDGINDAPVLAAADVGMSMGGIGTDAAIETADVVIMNDSLTKIGTAIDIAKKTKTIIWQNIIFALSVKGLFIVLGFFGIAGMWEAVFGDVGVALLALLNASRLINASST